MLQVGGMGWGVGKRDMSSTWGECRGENLGWQGMGGDGMGCPGGPVPSTYLCWRHAGCPGWAPPRRVGSVQP